MHLTAATALIIAAVMPVAAWGAPSADAERAQLRDSLETSCGQFSADDQWRQLDACHRDWFNAHEEAVWRLKLNPHGPKAEEGLSY